MISAKFVPLKYYTLSSQLQHLTSFSVGCWGRRILSPGQIPVLRKWSIESPAYKPLLSSIQNHPHHTNPSCHAYKISRNTNLSPVQTIDFSASQTFFVKHIKSPASNLSLTKHIESPHHRPLSRQAYKISRITNPFFFFFFFFFC